MSNPILNKVPLRLVIRIIVQGLSVTLFLFLVFINDLLFFEGYPISLFFELDPLITLATTFASLHFDAGLWLALGMIGLSFVLGRFFCGWICPLGALFQFFRWGSDKTKSRLLRRQERKEAKYAKRWLGLHTKYYVLIFFIVLTLLSIPPFFQLGFDSVNLIGVLDPLSLLYRTITMAVFPLFTQGTGYFSTDMASFLGGWVVGMLFIGLLLLNLKEPRFWCRKLCPLGAFYGLTAKVALFRIKSRIDQCEGCTICQVTCEGDAKPGSREFNVSECYVCLKCTTNCAKHLNEFGLQVPGDEKALPESPSRRKFVAGAVGGVAGGVFLVANPFKNPLKENNLIRPPGALAESVYVDRCIRCGACLKVCPSNVLQFTWEEAGLEGIWTPYMDYSLGYCQPECIACTQVCPTGAIQPLTLEKKLGTGDEKKPVKMGTAYFDKNLCIQFITHDDCLVCEEVCPVSPKAIDTVLTEDGRLEPFVDEIKCTGCGACQFHCPIRKTEGIRVHAYGESRHT